MVRSYQMNTYNPHLITLNRPLNDNLEQQVQLMFDKTFVNYPATNFCRLSDIANINPKRIISKNTKARYIEMSNLPTKGSFPCKWEYKDYNGGMKFTNGDTIMARITPCLENGKVAYINFLDKGEISFGSTEYIVISSKGTYRPEWFYFLTRNKLFIDYSIKHMNGSSGRQRVSGESIGDFQIPLFSMDSLQPLFTMSEIALKTITRNSLENIELSAIRDFVLPKLMSGELKINEINN
jgi:type I restriction enzyme, S subunit